LSGSNSLINDNKGNKNSPSDNNPDTSLDSETVEQGSHNILRRYLDEDMLTTIDPFDVVQLAYVIEICINHKNQAAAGRYLYANSRDKLKSPNDSDRLRKYLMKFGLRFDGLK
jgi:transcriptional regulatory protein RtcR